MCVDMHTPPNRIPLLPRCEMPTDLIVGCHLHIADYDGCPVDGPTEVYTRSARVLGIFFCPEHAQINVDRAEDLYEIGVIENLGMQWTCIRCLGERFGQLAAGVRTCYSHSTHCILHMYM